MTATINPPPQHICVTAAQQLVICRADPADLTWSLHISEDTLRRLKDGSAGASWLESIPITIAALQRAQRDLQAAGTP
jgi:hypothetical protein